MIKFNADLCPKEFVLACSGGPDSIAAASFLLRGKRRFELFFFHHGTIASDQGQAVVEEFSNKNKLTLNVSKLDVSPPPKVSLEAFWREKRYEALRSRGLPIVTAHHLDDVVETWIFSSAHGNPKLIRPVCGDVYRPFLLTRKSELVEWCIKHDDKFVIDASNEDVRFARNRIRAEIVPLMLKINPGLHKTIGRKIMKEMQDAAH